RQLVRLAPLAAPNQTEVGRATAASGGRAKLAAETAGVSQLRHLKEPVDVIAKIGEGSLRVTALFGLHRASQVREQADELPAEVPEVGQLMVEGEDGRLVGLRPGCGDRGVDAKRFVMPKAIDRVLDLPAREPEVAALPEHLR